LRRAALMMARWLLPSRRPLPLLLGGDRIISLFLRRPSQPYSACCCSDEF